MTANYADSVSLKKRNLSDQLTFDPNFADTNQHDNYTWERNQHWPAIDAQNSNTIIGTYAVYPNIDNFFTVECNQDFIVDFGNSNTYNVSAATDIDLILDYDDPNLDDTDIPVSFSNTTNLITRTDHGYQDGDTVRLFNLSTTTGGLVDSGSYYVVNSNTSTFEVSNEKGGTAITLLENGTATLLPYKIYTVTISGDGLNPTNVIFKNLPSTNNFVENAANWLELQFDIEEMTIVRIGDFNSSSYDRSYPVLESIVIWRSSVDNLASSSDYPVKQLRSLQNFEWHSNTVSPTTYAWMLSNCSNLRRVYIDSSITSSTATAYEYMFSDCTNLISISMPPLSSATLTMNNMFDRCINLKKLPDDLFANEPTPTNLSSTFDGCHNLIYIPAGINTSSCTNMRDTFRGCHMLQKIPPMDTSSVTTFDGTFYDCLSIKEVSIDASSVTGSGMDSTFRGCVSLEAVEIKNAGSCTSMSYLFNYCYNLKKINSDFDTSSCINFQSAFYYCQSLREVPNIDVSAAETSGGANAFRDMFRDCLNLRKTSIASPWIMKSDVSYMFSNCYSLEELPTLDFTNVTNIRSMFYRCYQLKEIDIINGDLTSLTGVTWDVFNACESLERIPFINFSGGTSFQGLFSGCLSLKYLPEGMDFSAGTNYISMFSQCKSLKYIPYFETNTSGLTTVQSMFWNMNSLNKLPPIDLSSPALTSTSQMMVGTSTVQDVTGFIGPDISFTMDSQLSSSMLDELYTNLPSTTGATLTVLGNYGTSGDNPSIATAKGWTVSG